MVPWSVTGGGGVAVGWRAFVNSWSLMSVAAGCECHVLLVFVWGLPLPWRTACGCCGSCWGCRWVYAAVWRQGQSGSSAEMGRVLFHSWLLCSSKSINSNSVGNHSPFHQPQLLNPFLQPHLQTALDTLWRGRGGGGGSVLLILAWVAAWFVDTLSLDCQLFAEFPSTRKYFLILGKLSCPSTFIEWQEIKRQARN